MIEINTAFDRNVCLDKCLFLGLLGTFCDLGLPREPEITKLSKLSTLLLIRSKHGFPGLSDEFLPGFPKWL